MIAPILLIKALFASVLLNGVTPEHTFINQLTDITTPIIAGGSLGAAAGMTVGGSVIGVSGTFIGGSIGSVVGLGAAAASSIQ